MIFPEYLPPPSPSTMTIKPYKPAPHLLHHSQMLPLLPTKNIMTHPEKALYSTTNRWWHFTSHTHAVSTFSLPPPINGVQSPTQWKDVCLDTLADTYSTNLFSFHDAGVLHTNAFAPSTTATRAQQQNWGQLCYVTRRLCSCCHHSCPCWPLAWGNAWYTMQQRFICQYAPHRFCFSHQSHHCLHPQQEALQSRCTASAPWSRVLACFSILLLEAEDVLLTMPAIIKQVWSQNRILICSNLVDLAEIWL